MDQNQIIPVILCGGSGTRLWPRSRPNRPKPFLPLIGEETLFQKAVRRTTLLSSPIVVTGHALVELVEEQLTDRSEATIIVEPAARNTAPAIAIAASMLPPDSIMLVCPSDHHIADDKAFLAAAHCAAKIAREGWLVCLTATAQTPATGYGYVRRGPAISDNAFEVAEFVEKPSEAKAESYLASGEFSWNAGIFAFRAGHYLEELTRFRGGMAAAVRDAVAAGVTTAGRFQPDPDTFASIQSESVDYAVFENTSRAAMIITDMGWSDIGTWDAVHAARPKDSSGNSAHGPVELIDCRHLLVETDGPRIVAIGVENLIVVVDGRDILISAADRATSIGRLSSLGEGPPTRS